MGYTGKAKKNHPWKRAPSVSKRQKVPFAKVERTEKDAPQSVGKDIKREP